MCLASCIKNVFVTHFYETLQWKSHSTSPDLHRQELQSPNSKPRSPLNAELWRWQLWDAAGMRRGYSVQQEGRAPGWSTAPNRSCAEYKMKQNLHSSLFHRKPVAGRGTTDLGNYSPSDIRNLRCSIRDCHRKIPGREHEAPSPLHSCLLLHAPRSLFLCTTSDEVFFPDHMSQDEGGKSCQEQRWAATSTWSRGDTEQHLESYIRMGSAQEQTLFQVKDSHESAMHVNEDSVSRRLGATNKTCLYFIIATLVALLVFALATIMVLVVQRTVSKSLLYSLFFSSSLFCWVFLFLFFKPTAFQKISCGQKISFCLLL